MSGVIASRPDSFGSAPAFSIVCCLSLSRSSQTLPAAVARAETVFDPNLNFSTSIALKITKKPTPIANKATAFLWSRRRAAAPPAGITRAYPRLRLASDRLERERHRACRFEALVSTST
jgi:hypothetical protein